MLNQKISSMMNDIRERQAAGEKMKCPRCGRDTMLPDLEANPESSVPGIRICKRCGNAVEAAHKMNADSIVGYEYYNWDVFHEQVPASDFDYRAASDVQIEVASEQLDSILELYKEWRDSDKTIRDELEIRAAAFLTLGGMNCIHMNPFSVRYAAADGRVFVQVRDAEDGIQFSISAEDNKK